MKATWGISEAPVLWASSKSLASFHVCL